MHQVVQSVRDGKTQVRVLPDPIATPGAVLIANSTSLISAGTERYVVELARKSLMGKAMDRPDHVRRILQKVRQEGLASTLGQVRAKLDEPLPLGYSSAGIVLECGKGVQEFKPGDRVASTGPHAGIVCVGRNLVAHIPDNVSFEQAAYGSVGAIALEGVRLSRVTLGENVLVVGLGLVGLITVGLLKAQGCRVYGIDLDPKRLELAKQLGLNEGATASDLAQLLRFSGPAGVDAVILTVATQSNQPIEFSAEACRVRGRIVLVGVAGLQIPRAPFFKKELVFTVSSSLGPGRGDPQYEERGIDYPPGFARWTAQRNLQAVLDLMSAGQLPVEKLTTHKLPIERAGEAYDLITGGKEPHIGILLEYHEPKEKRNRRIEFTRPQIQGKPLGISVIGTGNYSRLMLLPALSRLKGITLRGLCSAKGMTAEHSGSRTGFSFATTDAQEIFADAETQAVLVATRHDLHAELVIAAIQARKHVFVEKPLCIRVEELEAIGAAVRAAGSPCPIVAVGFNRRFAPATATLQKFFKGIHPLSLGYRFSPGAIPGDHWTQDEEVGGGRIVGEASHAIDLCIALTGSPVVRVFAESSAKTADLETSDDRVMITLRHANGSVSGISYQAGGDRAAPPERIEVFGGGRTGIIDSWDSIELWSSARRSRVSGGKDKGHNLQFETFIGACQGKLDWPTPWYAIENGALAALMAVRCLRDGEAMDIGESSA